MDGISPLSEPANPLYAYVGAFVDELQRAGVRHAVICPGSRSTPLALTCAAHSGLRCWVQIDERSAAFFALGLAKRLDQPVALLCTSGTAAANFLPAIVEAKLTDVPLLILTADRPPELRECGAPQAIDQNRLYGTHVKWYVETALPEASNESLRYIRTIANRAVAQARAIPAGPVHLNLPFREPLMPASIPGQSLSPMEQRDPLAWQGRADNAPYTRVYEAISLSADDDDVTQLAEQIAATPRGLIIVGPQTDPELVESLLQLARATGYPILADPLSQLRGAGEATDALISSYDAFLRNEHFSAHYEPQLILRFGAMPTSKPVLLYLKRHAANCTQIVVDGQEGWEEPTQLAAQVFHIDPVAFCRQLNAGCERNAGRKGRRYTQGGPTQGLDWVLSEAGMVDVNSGWANSMGNGADAMKGPVPATPNPLGVAPALVPGAPSPWTRAWIKADLVTREALTSAIADFPDLFEGRVFTELVELLPTHSLLYVGNSMPVRDMDTFFWPRVHALSCLGNRGANGIDGVISSALGASAAGGSKKPAVLVIGDLSFYHDLNGLLAARMHNLNLTIILVNNNGGGIFSFLPQAAYPEHFEQLFGTPVHLDFRPVVEMYGGTFQRITGWSEFQHTLQAGLTEGGLRVIEVPTERESNVTMHRQLWQVVEQALTAADLLPESEQ